ncbi:MAG TPA: hypothetical protein VIJ92_15850 [Ginsengibacter sp.]
MLLISCFTEIPGFCGQRNNCFFFHAASMGKMNFLLVDAIGHETRRRFHLLIESLKKKKGDIGWKHDTYG